MARKGNPGNLKPRTQEGLQQALDQSLAAGSGLGPSAATTAIRKAMMKHGYLARVTIDGSVVTATSGALQVSASLS
jgi:hypothetical protein